MSLIIIAFFAFIMYSSNSSTQQTNFQKDETVSKSLLQKKAKCAEETEVSKSYYNQAMGWNFDREEANLELDSQLAYTLKICQQSEPTKDELREISEMTANFINIMAQKK